MSEPLTADFFHLKNPWFPGISQKLFDLVLLNYKHHIVSAVKEALHDNMDAAIKFGNYMLPQLQETLARQRRDYGLSESFEPEFPIQNLADHIQENAPINNLAMENV